MKTGLQTLLLRTLLPMIVGGVGGYALMSFAHPEFDWLPWVGSGAATVGTAMVSFLIHRSRGERMDMAFWWLVVMIEMASVGFLLVPKFWVDLPWWVGPVAGLATGIILTVIFMIFARGKKPDTRHEEANDEDEPSVHVSQKLAAMLGLPGGTQVDMGEILKQLSLKTKAEMVQAEASTIAEVTKLIEMALREKILTPEQVKGKIAKLLEIDLPDTLEDESRPDPEPTSKVRIIQKPAGMMKPKW